MVPHPEIRRSMTAQRVHELEGAAAGHGRHAVRTRIGFALLALGERLTAEARAPRARPRRVLG